MEQHGVTIGDYSRCKKQNSVACPDCKAIAAKYMRERKKAKPEIYREQKRKYYEKYPHKKTELNRRRDRRKRARNRGLITVNFDTKDVLDLWGTDCHICGIFIDMRLTRNCGEEGWEMGLHLDHVIPQAKGGHNIISNVKPAHAICNIKKSDTATV
jgi:5-methylcytosine-specific restriction endonuclease McrA